jgi:hypothetical protein
MRYWLYLACKLVLASLTVFGLHTAVTHGFKAPLPTYIERRPTLFLHDMSFTFAVLGVWLASAGLFALVIWDQRRRCPKCLRRLVMPIVTGSWGNMLTIGRPKVEWICPYGHGTLRLDLLQITGKETPNWEAHDGDIWKELESYYQARK